MPPLEVIQRNWPATPRAAASFLSSNGVVRAGHFLEPIEPKGVVRSEASGQGKIRTLAEVVLQAPQTTAELVIDPARKENDDLTFAPFGHIVPAKPAGALAGL